MVKFINPLVIFSAAGPLGCVFAIVYVILGTLSVNYDLHSLRLSACGARYVDATEFIEHLGLVSP